MKLVKTSAIAVAISALLAGPVLAQGASSDTQIRGGARARPRCRAARRAASTRTPCAGGRSRPAGGAKTGMKGTVGAGSGAPKVTGGPATPPATSR